MAYTALYRKFRPDNFADVKGQDAIVTTLKNQIANDRVGHAYLFCGTRGTGKTTVAKLLARAVNCEHPVDGSPCGECPTCKAIANGSSLNVIEIDAASNNGVDNIREIREEVSYRPTEGRYKVYIIDEVHMLSTGAFNALLKTLEEPPAYVIFILATTEAHKIPVTIASRCQRYDFKRISVDTIEARLQELASVENIPIEEKALRYIAKQADGAMRDALSLLDRCMSYYTDRPLTYEDVLEVLGTVDVGVLSDMFRDIMDADVPAMLTLLENLILEGRDLTQFVSDFAWYLRNVLLLKVSPQAENMLDMSAEAIADLKEEAYAADENALMRYIRILSELLSSLRNATNRRVLVEVSLIKMTRPQMEEDAESLRERLERLENLVKEREDLFALTAIRPEVPLGETVTTARPKVVQKLSIDALPEDLTKVAQNWNGIIGMADGMYASYLKQVRITAIEDKLVLVPGTEFAVAFFNREEHQAKVQELIEQTIGKKVKLEVKALPQGTTFDDNFTDVEEYVKLPISTED